MNFENVDIKRIAVHKIYGKSKTLAEPYADPCTDVCKLGSEGDTTLHKRVVSCLTHKSKFFSLDLIDTSKDSFFETHKTICSSQKELFLETSQKIADKAASAHKHTNIPDGLLMVLDCKINGLNAVLVTKAEKTDAFSMQGSALSLIKDIFLSSDKTLYKVGVFIKVDPKNTDHDSYRFYVYDDAFSPSKDDLAFYFYSKFLGLSTEKNSKLQTNNLYKKLIGFANDHIDFSDLMNVQRSIDLAFMDESRKNLTATDFIPFFPQELSQLFKENIEQDFPNAIVKDSAILKGIKTKRIKLNNNTTLLLKNGVQDLITGSTANDKDLTILKAKIQSGGNYNYVLVQSGVFERPVVEE